MLVRASAVLKSHGQQTGPVGNPVVTKTKQNSTGGREVSLPKISKVLSIRAQSRAPFFRVLYQFPPVYVSRSKLPNPAPCECEAPESARWKEREASTGRAREEAPRFRPATAPGHAGTWGWWLGTCEPGSVACARGASADDTWPARWSALAMRGGSRRRCANVRRSLARHASIPLANKPTHSRRHRRAGARGGCHQSGGRSSGTARVDRAARRRQRA